MVTSIRTKVVLSTDQMLFYMSRAEGLLAAGEVLYIQRISTADESPKPYYMKVWDRYRPKANTANKVPHFAEQFPNPAIHANQNIDFEFPFNLILAVCSAARRRWKFAVHRLALFCSTYPNFISSQGFQREGCSLVSRYKIAL